ncbi:MAG: NAD(P)-binding protein [Acidobacteriota bacterium]
MDKVTILGSGMSAFGAVHRLQAEGVAPILYDKNLHYGGHTASFRTPSGFIFDEGPHVSFTKNERIQTVLAEQVANQYERVQAYINNYWKGYWIKHPAICNLHGLPSDLLVKILKDFIDVQQQGEKPVSNYEEWLVASYGKTYAELFPMEYTWKYHTTTARNLTTEWVGPRLYRAKLDEVLLGALSPVTPDIHYVSDYRYPSFGGFVAYLERFSKESALHLGWKVEQIDPKEKELTFSNGAKVRYTNLISPVPLPDLIPMIKGVPQSVLNAAERLACTTVVLVNVGIDRQDISEASWTYFYDREFPFSRVSFPHLMSPHTVPEKAGSIQAEIYFSKKYRPLTEDPKILIQPAIEGLRRCGLIREGDRILHQDAMEIPYANIIFDLDRREALSSIHSFLDEIGIAYCGRYGEWGYLWTDQSFVSGEQAAQKILDRLGKKRRTASEKVPVDSSGTRR